MKKTFLMMAFILLGISQMQAQRGQMSAEEREKMQAEMVQRMTERFVKDLDLKGEVATAFEATYAKYQAELMATYEMTPRQEQEQKKTSELSDEEIKARIEEAFARQEKQIEQQKARLEIQKKYYAEFSKTLTAKQLIRIFGQQRPRQNSMNGQGGQRGGFGGGNFGGGNFGGPRGGGFGPGF